MNKTSLLEDKHIALFRFLTFIDVSKIKVIKMYEG